MSTTPDGPIPDVKSKPAVQALGVVGAVIGALLGRYAGLHMLVPAIGAVIGGILARKLAPARAQPMVPAFAVQVGHLLWLTLGLMLVGRVSLDLLDVALLAGGLTWLLA